MLVYIYICTFFIVVVNIFWGTLPVPENKIPYGMTKSLIELFSFKVFDDLLSEKCKSNPYTFLNSQ